MTKIDGIIVFAIAPTARGFGYAVFEARAKPLDWGVKEARTDKNRQALVKIEAMLRTIGPAVVVTENRSHLTCRRSVRIRHLLKHIAQVADAHGIAIASYSQRDVRSAFGNKGKSKDTIAAAIIDEVPALRPWLPRRRRIWESEHHSMAIFEAAALAMVHYKVLRTPRAPQVHQGIPL